MFAALPLALLLVWDTSTPRSSPSPSPLKEIYHAESSPFCTVFRENVFRAVQGLMINDAVIAQGEELMARMGSDPYGRGVAQYQLGQIAYQTASNLTKVYQIGRASCRERV